ncbi:MAG: response regulator [Pleurocapsa sp. MO_226.B13]|nr:response regulator [Pleurocapsa sp. MO_226.B13]
MLNSPCRVLLVEDEPEDVERIQTMLCDARSAFFKGGFKLACAETLAEAKLIISQQQFDIILLDLMLPDSRHINSLEELQQQVAGIPIIVQTALEDEVIAVKALELGAYGHLPKIASDRNLLLYALRTAIERKQQLANWEQSQQLQQDRELDLLERLFADVPSFSNKVDSLKQRMPDVFQELESRYHQLLDRFVEQKIYKVDYDTSEQIRILIEQLGYLQATPRDIIELHTTTLKQKQNALSRKKSKVFTIEGRYLLLELMGKLAAYYRRYYIGLNKINLAQDYYKMSSPEE